MAEPLISLLTPINLKEDEEYGIFEPLDADALKHFVMEGYGYYCTEVLELSEEQCQAAFPDEEEEAEVL